MYINQNVVNIAALGSCVVAAFIYITALISRFGFNFIMKSISSCSLVGLFLVSSPKPAWAIDPWETPESTQSAITPAPDLISVQPDVSTDNYVVQPGDNFWSITKKHVHEGETIVELWQRIIGENSVRIRSGNPNLIFPGEIIIIEQE